jgi:lambda repressor-like predicted transcriptional regulator
MKDIESRIESQGRSKTWLMKQLGISRRTFYSRLKNDDWRSNEMLILLKLGLVG